MCVIHRMRGSLRYASKADGPEIATLLRPISTAPNQAAALERLAEFDTAWGTTYPMITRKREQARAAFVPFLAVGREIRSVICSTRAIESINARYRRAANASGHRPNEQVALKRICPATLALGPTGKGTVRWANRWNEALNAFDLKFDGRVSTARRRPERGPAITRPPTKPGLDNARPNQARPTVIVTLSPGCGGGPTTDCPAPSAGSGL